VYYSLAFLTKRYGLPQDGPAIRRLRLSRRTPATSPVRNITADVKCNGGSFSPPFAVGSFTVGMFLHLPRIGLTSRLFSEHSARVCLS